jgi:alkylhydroperoxidase/carboxymuconolactone decarboxylase family protein YurZ
MSTDDAARLASIARLAAAETLGNQEQVADALHAARNAGLGWEQCYEILLQMVAYTGYPRTLNALTTFRSVSGIPAPERPTEPWEEHAAGEWPRRGVEIFRQLWPGRPLAESVRPLSPELAEWVINDDFGRIFGRPGLTLIEREAAVLGSLFAQEVVPQLRAHRFAFLAVGGADAEIDSIVSALAGIIRDEALDFARETLIHLRAERP